MGESAPELDLVLRRSVVLIGMMGAGKTAVGRALAARLAVPMKDSDAEIVASAQLSIAEIFERYGEPFFRDKETRVIDRLLRGPPCVLSTGGGAWMAEKNRALLTERAAVLWLEADLELLWSRVRHKTTRPLLRTEDPRGRWEILTERVRRSTRSHRCASKWRPTGRSPADRGRCFRACRRPAPWRRRGHEHGCVP
jgi:shikimate kinase